jgi:predicted PurR-regulated permease PerM
MKLSNVSFRDKVISIIVLALFFVTVWFMLDLAIFTFIITFIGWSSIKLLKRLIARTPLSRIPDGILLIVIYVIGIAFIALCSVAFVPILLDQTQNIAYTFINFDFNNILSQFSEPMQNFIKNSDIDFNSYLDRVGMAILSGVLSAGKFSLNMLLSLALSFIMLLEKDKIRKFGDVMYRSRIAFIYHYFIIFGVNFCRTFSKVMKVQVTIAFVNSALSIIILAILGFRGIIWGLGVMIFILGLVPVAGVIISLVPLSIIAFNIGGVTKVIEVLIMVAVIHAIEAYILNPKLMANRTRLPVSFVFIILLVAEKYLGVWGLLIGVPIFIFLMTIFGVKYNEIEKASEKPHLFRDKLRNRIKNLRKGNNKDRSQ